jgi:hypothetical protein
LDEKIKIKKLELSHQEPKWKMIIKLEVEENDTFKFILSYMNPNCSWKSNYDLRLNSSKKELNLTYYADIQQNTGENWNNVMPSFFSIHRYT